MGFRKGRAAKASANAVAASAAQAAVDAADADALNILDDGEYRVHYTAHNGSRYTIHVKDMKQTNVHKGTVRTVHRRQGHGKNWTMWQFEASRAPRRNYTHSSTVYIQYPKWVGFALEERWRHATSATGTSCEGQRYLADWKRLVNQIDEASFNTIFDASVRGDLQHSCHHTSRDVLLQIEAAMSTDEADVTAMIRQLVNTDADLQQAMFDRIVLSQCAPTRLAAVLRWLLLHGFVATRAHCRQVGLATGSLVALRVLIVEAKVDVVGLELFDAASSSSFKHLATGGHGWIQHCKQSVKVLLARGAVLGHPGSRSRLLKKLESEVDALWYDRVLSAMRSNDVTGFPDAVLDLIQLFLIPCNST